MCSSLSLFLKFDLVQVNQVDLQQLQQLPLSDPELYVRGNQLNRFFHLVALSRFLPFQMTKTTASIIYD